MSNHCKEVGKGAHGKMVDGKKRETVLLCKLTCDAHSYVESEGEPLRL